MGGSAPSYNAQDTYIPTPAPVPGATDVSSGTTEETTAARAATKQRKKRGVASTYRSSMSANDAAGKTRLGD